MGLELEKRVKQDGQPGKDQRLVDMSQGSHVIAHIIKMGSTSTSTSTRRISSFGFGSHVECFYKRSFLRKWIATGLKDTSGNFTKGSSAFLTFHVVIYIFKGITSPAQTEPVRVKDEAYIPAWSASLRVVMRQALSTPTPDRMNYAFSKKPETPSRPMRYSVIPQSVSVYLHPTSV